MPCSLLLEWLGVQPWGCFHLHPWHPDAHGPLGFQGNSELDGPVSCRWRKVGLIVALQVVLVFFPLALLGWGYAGAGVAVGLCGPGGG